MKSIFILLSLFISLAASAGGETCKKMFDCIETVSKLTGVKYLYSPGDLGKETILFNDGIKLTKENADILLSEALHLAGYTRVASQVPGVMKIINARDIRYSGDVPKFNASKTVTPEIPMGADYIQLVYQGIPGGEVAEIARNMRPFMSRYGRIVDFQNSQLLIVADTASMIKSFLPILQNLDRPLDAKARESMRVRIQKQIDAAKKESEAVKKDGVMPAAGAQ